MSKPKSKRKIIVIAIAAILAVAAAVAVCIAVFGKTDKKPVAAPAQPKSVTDKTRVEPNDKLSVIGYLARATMSLPDKKSVKLDIDTQLSIDDKTMTFSEESPALLAALKYMKPQILDGIEKNCVQSKGDFGKDYSVYIQPVNFQTGDTDFAKISVGTKDSHGNTIDTDCRFVSVEFSGGRLADIPLRIYSSTRIDGIRSTIYFIENQFKDWATTQNPELTITKQRIEAKIERETDRIIWIKYTNTFKFDSQINFSGELLKINPNQLSFIMKAQTIYNFTYK